MNYCVPARHLKLQTHQNASITPKINQFQNRCVYVIEYHLLLSGDHLYIVVAYTVDKNNDVLHFPFNVMFRRSHCRRVALHRVTMFILLLYYCWNIATVYARSNAQRFKLQPPAQLFRSDNLPVHADHLLALLIFFPLYLECCYLKSNNQQWKQKHIRIIFVDSISMLKH